MEEIREEEQGDTMEEECVLGQGCFKSSNEDIKQPVVIKFRFRYDSFNQLSDKLPFNMEKNRPQGLVEFTCETPSCSRIFKHYYYLGQFFFKRKTPKKEIKNKEKLTGMTETNGTLPPTPCWQRGHTHKPSPFPTQPPTRLNLKGEGCPFYTLEYLTYLTSQYIIAIILLINQTSYLFIVYTLKTLNKLRLRLIRPHLSDYYYNYYLLQLITTQPYK